MASQFDYTDIVIWDGKLYEIIGKYDSDTTLGKYSAVANTANADSGWIYQLRRGDYISSWIAEKYLKIAGVCSQCDGATIDDYLCPRCRNEE